jgi:hypothetical protein
MSKGWNVEGPREEDSPQRAQRTQRETENEKREVKNVE